MASVIRAPEFPDGSVWLNTVPTGSCLRFGEELKGRVVLLDFWTYCCVNCMHVLPDLAWLEEKYKDRPFVVVGVHSNKFEEEGKVEAVRAAVARYGVRHPVVLDEGHRIWDGFAVRAWPTLVLVGADGRLVGQVSGEGHRKLLDVAVGRGVWRRGRGGGFWREGRCQSRWWRIRGGWGGCRFRGRGWGMGRGGGW